MNRPNRQTRVAWTWGGIAAIGVAGAVLPSLLGVDGMAGGYALAFVSGFVALCATITAAIFAARARVLGRLLSGQHILAHWTYPAEERAGHVDRELAEERGASWTLFLIILGFCLVIGIAFWIADPEAGRFVFFVLMGVAALLAGVAWLAPRLRHRKRRHASPEAIVSPEGAYVFGLLHTWRLLGARVEEAQLTRGRQPVLRVRYSAPMLYGRFFYTRQAYTVQIPVPPDEETRAEAVVNALRRVAGGLRPEEETP